MTAAPMPAVVREHVAAVRRKVRDARVIGIRADEWSGPDNLQIDDQRFRVAMCRSPLEVREELIALDDDNGLILLTPVPEDELGGDVVARLAKRRVFPIETWALVLGLFKARTVDPRVRRDRWLADTLVEIAPPDGYPTVATGVLDADTVWDTLLQRRLAFPDGRPDALALLRWARRADSIDGYLAQPTEAREAVRQRVADTAGGAGQAILDAIDLGFARDVVALGLVCRVLFSTARETEPKLGEAAVRFERFHRLRPMPLTVAERWAESAERLMVERVGDVGWSVARKVVGRADGILREVNAETYLHLSEWSPGGFEQRLERLASALEAAVDGSSTRAALEEAATYALSHRVAREEPARARRMQMSLRLVRWLHRAPMREARNLVEAAQRYARDGAFVDLARLALLGGDHPPTLGRVYGDLLKRVHARREQENEEFGRRMAASGADPGPDSDALVPVERVLERVVARVATHQPLLFLVADGLTRAVYQELLESIVERGWRVWRPDVMALAEAPWAALAALPSVTEVSRTSLLCGTLRRGSAASEKRGFRASVPLRHVSRSAHPPELFHKGDLTEPQGRALSHNVQHAVANADQRIVGAVVNAVDDLLFKGDQLQPRWSLDAIPLLRALFDAAASARRVIVVTSDHGHLLDEESAFAGREAGERWREDGREPSEDELRLDGPRVLGKVGSAIIVPWSERTRYGPRKNGYHGGVTPQEAVLPLAVLTPGDTTLEGYLECGLSQPDWWFEPAPVDTAPEPAPAKAPRRPRERTPATPLLDALDAPVAPAEPRWIAALWSSDAYLAQLELVSRRGVPSPEELGRLLMALTSHGGKLTKPALEQRLGLPLFRLNGLIAASRRVLNVDGFAVLHVDEVSDTVELNEPMLLDQFGLETPTS